MKSNEEIEACPFCDHDQIIFQSRDGSHFIQCIGCFAEGPKKPNKPEALKAWNCIYKLYSELNMRKRVNKLDEQFVCEFLDIYEELRLQVATLLDGDIE